MRKVPKLRFKEFSDEWEKLNAEEIFENISNKKHNGDLPVLAVTQDKGVVSRDSLDLKINSSEEGIKNYKIIEPGNFIISLRSFQGGIEYSNILGIGSPAYTVLKSKKNIEDIFYKFYLKKSSFISELNKTIEGIRDGKQISYSMFSKLKLPYPSIEEQEKIANFLSSIDKKISLTEEKLELFREYKKGVMQKIFSQELRFKDSNCNDYPEWEEKRLGEISKICTGKLDANAMVENGRYRFYTCAKEFYYIDSYSFDTEALLISGNGANVGYIHYYKGKFNAYQRTYVLDNFEENIIFIKYILEKNLKTRIEKEKNSGNTPYIVLSVLTDMVLQIPTLEEQQKIADFLSSIDNKIESIEKELEGLKEFKKGLLQQMFV
jgi:type I restriction enzyme S subunit